MSLNNYRAYFFQNMYLQGIHAGVQSQHCTAEMFVKYGSDFNGDIDSDKVNILNTWACEDKTTIVLNGGMSGMLQEIATLFNSTENNYPWATFSETEFALNGALTNVGIILPEEMYNYDKIVKMSLEDENISVPKLTEFELEIVEILRGKHLAH
jgi:hypothetical protein